MNSISIVSKSLRRNGVKRTLKQAEDHNSRRIATEYGTYGNIDPSRISLNKELIGLNGESLENAVDENLIKLGIDLNNPRIKAKNRGLAIESVFSVTAGHKCDFNSLYSDCLDWFKSTLPECPILHAIIHHDEDVPHMHVVFIPIINGRLLADKLKGFKGKGRQRVAQLLSSLDSKYGLIPMQYLKKSHKKAGVKLALELTEKMLKSDAIKPIKSAIKQSIAARPELYLISMGYTFEKFQEHLRNTTPIYVGDANDHN